MTITSRRILCLAILGTVAVGLWGCARSTVAIDNVAVSAEGDKKPAEPAAPAPPGEPFQFPKDRGGQMLGQTLTPSVAPPSDAVTAPLTLPPPAAVARPEVPMQPSTAAVVRLPSPVKPPALRPHSPGEDVPLAGYRATPAGPERIEMAAGARIHIPSPPVELPPALPYLALPGVDRVPLEDPTSDESLKAALSAAVPVRTTPAPFDRRGLPDPFEHVQTIRLKTTPAEDTIPSSSSPQLSRP